jgi:HK97 family phage prohead protease
MHGDDKRERTFEIEGMEMRAVEGQQAPVITGYAVVFDSWSDVLTDSRGRPFRERFAPGAFDRTLAGDRDIVALWNHNADLPLGRTRNDTLKLRRDGLGVRFELELPPTQWGQDAATSIRRRDVSGMSFTFGAKGDNRDTWEKPGADGIAHRTVLDADLYEVSPVVFPAYAASSVAVRAVNVPDFETETADKSESDSRAAGEIEQGDDGGRAAAVGVLREQIEILRRR